jgi:subfamily B ATP-binding cassette protein MsbA
MTLKVYFRILQYVKRYKKYVVFSFIMSIFFSIFSALSVYLTIPLLKALFTDRPTVIQQGQTDFISGLLRKFQHLLDGFIYSGSMPDALVKICIMIFIAFLFKNISNFFQSVSMQYVEKGVLRDIRNQIYEKLNKLSIRYFSVTKTGNLISRMTNDLNSVQLGISAAFNNLLKDPVLIIILILLAISISWQMTLMALLIFPITAIFILKIGSSLRRRSQRVLEKLAEIVSIISETIYGAKIIRAFRAERYKNIIFRKASNEHLRLGMKNARAFELVTPITEMLTIIAGVVIIWYGGKMIFIENSLKPEEFFGFLFIIFQLIVPIKNLASVNSRVQESSVSGTRIFEIIDEEVEVKNSVNAVEITDFKNSIELKDVSFYYEEGKTILKNVNFKINKSEVIAIAGTSGSGKSTLADLISRFYDVTGGEILFDGINIKEIDIDSLRNLIGIVPQETILFNDTIRNNILFGLKDVDDGKLAEVCKYANAYDFIMKTENKFDTIVGERGLKLSGGQKQRIAIARALLRNPQILILDEATSSLDTESEQLVQEAIENLMLNRTSIVIAHRLSTIKNADKIIVIDNKTVSQAGTHIELMQEEGIYKKLYEIQFQI